jgi:serine/threonine protein phosphatase PrpC
VAHHTYSFGASVRGPLHCKEGRPNEDAWLRAEGRFGALAVVCDGMGSKPNARAGSQAACAAVKEAVSRWSKADGAPPSYLSHLIEVLWRLRLHPTEPASAATTCLLALATARGTWVVGGIGDGLALARSGSELRIIIGDRGDDFANETTGLGVSKGPRAWTLTELPPTEGERIVVLATDGVADDLLPERLNGFCDWLTDTFEHLTPMERWRTLAVELRDWPTPGHLDDKTLAVIHKPASASEETR